jgi:hypothetical protein
VERESRRLVDGPPVESKAAMWSVLHSSPETQTQSIHPIDAANPLSASIETKLAIVIVHYSDVDRDSHFNLTTGIV